MDLAGQRAHDREDVRRHRRADRDVARVAQDVELLERQLVRRPEPPADDRDVERAPAGRRRPGVS
jgi:hypothetical protein